MKVGDLDIFYREAGPNDAPAILLLHGFPTSSQMFRNLIPLLADAYHVVAPDYPGYGHSSMPSRDQFAYTFDNLAKVIDEFTVLFRWACLTAKKVMVELPPPKPVASRLLNFWV